VTHDPLIREGVPSYGSMLPSVTLFRNAINYENGDSVLSRAAHSDRDRDNNYDDSTKHSETI
jgi:hypothetical protein